MEETHILVIEARHLDTDDRTIVRFEVERPPGEAEQREHLTDRVAEMHPGARLRSFAAGAASFLASDHLVVAHYAAREHDERPAAAASEVALRGTPVLQQSLFAG